MVVNIALPLFFIANKIRFCAGVSDSCATECTWKEEECCRTATDEDVVGLLQTQINMHRLVSHDGQIPSVLFVKTHKTGSSTIANILHRLGDAQNKEFVLPCQNDPHGFIGWPLKFPGGGCDRPEAANQFDIICNHAVYNRTAMLAYLKKATSPFVFTVLREPVSQIQSAFDYFHDDENHGNISASDGSQEPTEEGQILLQKHFEKERAAGEDLWDDRIDFLRKVQNNPDLFKLETRARFGNSQSYDLGWYEAHEGNNAPSDEDIQKWVEGLDFSYVMVTEMFDEGLLLLRQKLQLKLEDISNLHLKQSSDPHLKPSVKQSQEIEDFLHIDFRLYAHYQKKFVQEWERYARSENSVDLKKLRELNDHISSACAQKIEVHGESVYPADCTWALRADTPEYDKYLRKKQAMMHWADNSQ